MVPVILSLHICSVFSQQILLNTQRLNKLLKNGKGRIKVYDTKSTYVYVLPKLYYCNCKVPEVKLYLELQIS